MPCHSTAKKISFTFISRAVARRYGRKRDIFRRADGIFLWAGSLTAVVSRDTRCEGKIPAKPLLLQNLMPDPTMPNT